MKERVCPLVIKLMASGLLADAQRGRAWDSVSENSTSGGNTYAGSTEFGVNVRLNRIIILLCSKYFECLVSE